MSSPGTSFHSDTARALSARASSVAERSEPPRPSVVTAPSGDTPRNPGTIAISPRASSGRITARAARSVPARSGVALPNESSVWITRVASMYRPFTRAARSAAATSVALSRSPRATMRSVVRGVSSRTASSPRTSVSSSRNDSSIARTTSACCFAPRNTARATSTWRARSRADSRSPPATSPITARFATPSSESVTPAIADSTTTVGSPRWRTINATACRTAVALASEAPPNLCICGRGARRVIRECRSGVGVGQELPTALVTDQTNETNRTGAWRTGTLHLGDVGCSRRFAFSVQSVHSV